MSGQAAVRPLIGSSWKMHLTPSQVDAYLRTLLGLVADVADRDLFVLPAFPALQAARDRLTGSNVAWGAQDVHPADEGAHTGDVSAPMLADLGCRYVMVGHAERRRDHGETYEMAAAKVSAVVRAGMVPIICLGETTPTGPNEATAQALADLDRALKEPVPGELPDVVIAYEPGWAIGAGMVAAPPADIGTIHRDIHDWLAGRGFGPGRARVIYGGSVDTPVARELLCQPGVDGLFVGRASLDPERFAAICRTPAPWSATTRVPATA